MDSNPTTNSDIVFSSFLPDHQRAAVANLLFDAFKTKFIPLHKDPKALKSLLMDTLNDDRCILATDNGDLVGVLGLNYDNKSFFEFRLKDVTRHYGAFKGFRYWLSLRLMHHRPNSKKEMWVEGLAVSPDYRGKGVGRKLLYEISKTFGKKGVKNLWIEVANTNTPALRLYQRSGFRISKTYKIHLFAKSLGFTKVHCMRKNIK